MSPNLKMRQKLLKLLLVLLLIFLVFSGIIGAWTWYQMNIGQSLETGNVQMGSALGGLVIPQTAVFYGLLAGIFLLLTVIFIWITYRLIMFPPEDVAETAVVDENSDLEV